MRKDLKQGSPSFDDDNVHHFMTDPDWVIENYQHNITDGYYGREWPKTLVPIGTDGGGGLYAINIGDSKMYIYYIDWESMGEEFDLPSQRYRLGFSEFRKAILSIDRDVYGE